MTTADAVVERAPAKVNLTLHVTGRRADGYHLLDSLVVFAGPEACDTVAVAHAPTMSLRVTGPRAAGVPTDAGNLMWRAAEGVLARSSETGVALLLDKHLPAAGGIGGGSADAAATLRAMARLFGSLPCDTNRLAELGADVPVCHAGVAARMRGIGEDVRPVTVPPLPAVLVNPGVEVPTGPVFAELERRDNPGMPERLPTWRDAAELAAWLAGQRNDLESPARRIAPQLGEVLAALAARPGCLLARMSGSGATCFGLFATPRAAETAAGALARPGWWAVATTLA